MHALTGARVFTGAGFLDGHALVIAGERIAGLMPEAEVPPRAELSRLTGGLLAPGFVDLQVNGGGGVLFNDAPTTDGIHAIGSANRRFGTTAFLPTLISDDPAKTAPAARAVRQSIEDGPGEGAARVLGLHLEGPFLNRNRRGVHQAALIRAITEPDIGALCELAQRPGALLITLAPECIPPGVIRRLSDAGAVVAAGHTEADPAEVAAARAEGLAGFTHLFNAMPPLAGRAPGPIGACLADSGSWCGVIVDGVHVDPVSIKAVLAAKPPGTVILVTDAMPPVGADEPAFRLYGETITAIDGRCATAEGTLAGSALDMASAVRNALTLLGLDVAEALRMASLYPARALGVDDLYGRLAPGGVADIIWLDDSLHVRASWVGGSRHDHGQHGSGGGTAE